MPETQHQYSMKILCYFIVIFTGAVLPVFGLELYRQSFHPVAYLVLLVFSFACASVLVVVWKITLTAQGLNGFNFWGFYRFVPWQQIDHVKPFNFIGLRYLRVYSQGNDKPLWVPLFIKDYQSFSTMACSLPPEGNVFRAYFE